MVDFNDSDTQLTFCLISKSSLGWLWHRRLGHVGMKQLNKLLRHDLVRGLKDVTFEKDKPCRACQAKKQVRNAHPKKNEMSTSKVFVLLHIDLFGPMLGILNVITKSRLSFLILITAPKMPNLSLIPLKPSCHPQHDMRDALLKYAIAHLNK